MTERVQTSSGYMLCASPRTGSTLLCDLLAETGCAGVPGSYFRPASVSTFATAWQLSNPSPRWDQGYAEAARHHGSDPTGCFALRIMWSDMPGFLDRLRALYPSDSDDRTRLGQRFGIDQFLHLSRRDKVAQAVSLVLAQQTGLWHVHADGTDRQRNGTPTSPVYDADQIAAELRMLHAEASGWNEWFAAESISPIVVTYEDLAGAPGATLASVLEQLGRPTQEWLPDPATARMASAINKEWCERFRAG